MYVGICSGGLFYDADGCVLLCFGGHFVIGSAKACILVDIHRHSVGNVQDGKTGVGACQAVLYRIKTLKLFFLADTQTNQGFDDYKCKGNGNQCPRSNAQKPQ